MLMGHFQSCCGTLTLRHAELSLEDKCMTAGGINSVHCGLCKVALTSLCMLKERERREEKRREGGGREGEATDPGREKKTRHEKTCALLPPVQVAGVRRPAKQTPRRRRKRTQAGHQKEREGEEEGGREERRNPRNQAKTNPAKNPAAFSTPNLARTLDPNDKTWPKKSSQYITGVLPTKLLDTNVPKKRRTLKSQANKKRTFAAGFFERK